MVLVSDIWEDAKVVFGNCNETQLYRRINDAVELLSAKGEWEPLNAYVDIAVTGRKIAFPTVVETPLAINLDGVPSLGHDKLFEFHLNGPGDNWSTRGVKWRDGGLRPIMVDLPAVPEGLSVYSEVPADAGDIFRVYGADQNGSALRTEVTPGNWEDGLRLVVQYPTATVFSSVRPSRIDRVLKPITDGRVKLVTSGGALIGDYQHNETSPFFRRVVLNREASTARVFFRRASAKVASLNDWIALPQRYALKLMLQALKGYDDEEIEKALGFESQAVRMTQERNSRLNPPVSNPIQVSDAGSVGGGADDDDLFGPM
jgi:hypothetical protein